MNGKGLHQKQNRTKKQSGKNGKGTKWNVNLLIFFFVKHKQEENMKEIKKFDWTIKFKGLAKTQLSKSL